MSVFRTAFSHTIKEENIEVGFNGWLFAEIDGEIRYLIPVTRYAGGMSKGLYHDENKDENFCGTFFYHEPQSTTFLSYSTRDDFFNKSECAVSFRGGNIKDYSLYNRTIAKHISGVWPADMMMTPSEAYKEKLSYLNTNEWRTRNGPTVNNKTPFDDMLKDRMNPGWRDRVPFVDDLPQTKRYAGYLSGMYAMEDDLDQEICLGGKQRGLDIIVLTNMIGMYQVVTEVLDCRSRSECFANLVYLE